MSVHVSDGTQGGVTGLILILIYRMQFIFSVVVIDNNELISTIILAAVGAVVGFFVHLILRLITKKFIKDE